LRGILKNGGVKTVESLPAAWESNKIPSGGGVPERRGGFAAKKTRPLEGKFFDRMIK
jgi:hypothetical protein